MAFLPGVDWTALCGDDRQGNCGMKTTLDSNEETRTSEERDGEDWQARLNSSGHVQWLLFLFSFLESTVLAIPLEVVLVPFLLTHQNRLWQTASVVTAGCLAGSLVGYGVGYFFIETVGRWAIQLMGWGESYQRFASLFADHGFVALLAAGILPVPFQAAMLTAGAAGYPLWKFTLAATIARGIRYFGLAALVFFYGRRALTVWRQHRTAALVGLLAAIGALWLLTRWASSMLR